MAVTIDGSAATITATSTTAIGVGQSWTDVKTTPGRALNSTYTNSTGKTIVVYVCATCGVNTVAGLYVTVNGQALGPASSYTSGQSQVTFVVPNGHTYLVQANSGAPVVSWWVELR